ncbi:hypothetical protein PIB30_073717 [Stylosanthes scabra]|uniref:Uncharacterized protein n=1 Tax=Stylosanthes scabra TaxID=79078 RepID=A0ABU6TP43_9FABA|nr:hypothetical protein [Stylosanthes scabra]
MTAELVPHERKRDIRIKSTPQGDPPQEGMITQRSQSSSLHIDKIEKQVVMRTITPVLTPSSFSFKYGITLKHLKAFTILGKSPCQLKFESVPPSTPNSIQHFDHWLTEKVHPKHLHAKLYHQRDYQKTCFNSYPIVQEAEGNSPEIPRPFQHRVHTDRKLTIISSTQLFGKKPKRRQTIRKESNKKNPKVYGRDPRMLPRLYATIIGPDIHEN